MLGTCAAASCCRGESEAPGNGSLTISRRLQTLAAVATANAAVLGGLVNLPAVTVFAPTDRAFANLAVAANVTLDPASAGVFGIVVRSLPVLTLR